MTIHEDHANFKGGLLCEDEIARGGGKDEGDCSQHTLRMRGRVKMLIIIVEFKE